MHAKTSMLLLSHRSLWIKFMVKAGLVSSAISVLPAISSALFLSLGRPLAHGPSCLYKFASHTGIFLTQLGKLSHSLLRIHILQTNKNKILVPPDSQSHISGTRTT